MMRIAVIGGGATGALASLHLARVLSDRAAEIVVIEPAEEIGRGLASATTDPRHLLNVRVANMSAFDDQPTICSTGCGLGYVKRRLPLPRHSVLFHGGSMVPISPS
jgi:hypothetical protein